MKTPWNHTLADFVAAGITLVLFVLVLFLL